MTSDSFKELSEDELVARMALENDPDVLIIFVTKFFLINSDWALCQGTFLLCFLFFGSYLDDGGLKEFGIFGGGSLEMDIIS